MNFVSGKCPNCGANVNLDSNLKTTYCAYCGSQISVEESVEKLKIELSGKVEVDGINSLSKLYKNAESCVKLEDYEKAFNTYTSIINDNPEEIEAYKGALISVTENMTKPITDSGNYKQLFDKYLKHIEALDEEKKYTDFLVSFNNYRLLLRFSDEIDIFYRRTNNCTNLNPYTDNYWDIDTVNKRFTELNNLYNNLTDDYKNFYQTKYNNIQNYIEKYSNPLTNSSKDGIKFFKKIGKFVIGFFIFQIILILILDMLG